MEKKYTFFHLLIVFIIGATAVTVFAIIGASISNDHEVTTALKCTSDNIIIESELNENYNVGDTVMFDNNTVRYDHRYHKLVIIKQYKE